MKDVEVERENHECDEIPCDPIYGAIRLDGIADEICSDRDDYTAEKTSRPLASGRDDFITAKVM